MDVSTIWPRFPGWRLLQNISLDESKGSGWIMILAKIVVDIWTCDFKLRLSGSAFLHNIGDCKGISRTTKSASALILEYEWLIVSNRNENRNRRRHRICEVTVTTPPGIYATGRDIKSPRCTEPFSITESLIRSWDVQTMYVWQSFIVLRSDAKSQERRSRDRPSAIVVMPRSNVIQILRWRLVEFE